MTSDRMNVWYYHFRDAKKATCPCCKKAVMNRGLNDWEAGHIIPKRDPYLGPLIYENIRPICCRCNDNDRYYDSNYHYMVHIGTMDSKDLKPALDWIRACADDHTANPHKYRCIATLKSGSKTTNCKNLKLPHGLYCGTHLAAAKQSRSDHIKRLYRYLASMVNSEEFEPEEIKQFKKMLAVTASWKRDLASDVLIGTTLREIQPTETISPEVSDKTDDIAAETSKSNDQSPIVDTNVEKEVEPFKFNLREFHANTSSRPLTKSETFLTTIYGDVPIKTIVYTSVIDKKLNQISTTLRNQITKQCSSSSLHVSMIKVIWICDQEEPTNQVEISRMLTVLKSSNMVPVLSRCGIAAETRYVMDGQLMACRYYYRVLSDCGVSLLDRYVPSNKREHYRSNLIDIESPKEFENQGDELLTSYCARYISEGVRGQIIDIVRELYSTYMIHLTSICLDDFRIDPTGKVRLFNVNRLKYR